MPRSALHVLLALTPALAAPAAAAQSPPKPPASHTVTLDIVNAPVSVVLARIARAAHVRIVVDPRLKTALENCRCTVHAEVADVEGVLNGIAVSAERAGATWPVAYENCGVPTYSIASNRITFACDHQSPDEALRDLLHAAYVDFVFADGVLGTRPVTVNFKDVPWQDALAAVIVNSEYAATARVRVRSGIYTVERPGWRTDDWSNLTASASLLHVSPDAAVSALLKSTAGWNLVFAGVPAFKVSEEASAVPCRQLMEQMLHDASKHLDAPLSYRIDRGVVTVDYRIMSVD